MVLQCTVQAAPVFVNGLAISGGTGVAVGASVNDGRLGFFSDIYYDQIITIRSATNAGRCRTTALAVAR